MRALIWTVTVLAAVAISGDALAQSAGPFDGKWTTVVSCRRRREPGVLPFRLMPISRMGF